MPDSKPHKTYPVLAALGIAGTALVLFVTSRYGAGTTSDSVNYIAAARSLAAGRGLLCSDLDPFTAWPPLFPALLALIDLIAGIDPLQSVRWVNALCFGTVIFLSGAWVRQRTESSVAAAICSLSVLLSFTLVMVSRMAWSEPLFMLFTMGFLMAADGFMRSKNPRFLYLAAALAALSGLTRYMGVTLIPTGLALIAIHPKLKLSKKIKSGLIFAAIAALPLFLWTMRNYAVSGTFTGPRDPSSLSLKISAIRTCIVISKWFLSERVPGMIRVPMAGAVFIMPAAFMLRRFARDRNGERNFFFGMFLPVVIFLALYLSWLAVSSTFIAFDVIGDRLLSPIHAPMITCFIVMVFRAAGSLENHLFKNRARLLFFLILCGWLLYPASSTFNASMRSIRAGAGGYANSRWQNSETARYLRENRFEGRVLSNDPQAAYLLASIPARWSAYKRPYNSASGKSNLADFLQTSEGGYLVWFDYPAKRFFTALELEEKVDLFLLADLNDGAVYSIGKAR